MSLKLYHFAPSAPSRGALLAARAVGVPIEIENLNLFEKQQMNDDFIKINPQHCVPTLSENGFALWESRAIATYLASKYGKDDTLYPEDFQKRAMVDQRLYFDATFLYPKIRAICYPILFLGEKEISEEKRSDLNNSLQFMDAFLGNTKWLAGDHLTLADTSNYASLSSILAAGWDISKFKNIQRWVEQCASFPGYAENQEGAEQFGYAVKSKLQAPL